MSAFAPTDPNQVQGRPPYIQFREDFVEDREKTLSTGTYASRPVNIVVIRQAGSKDSVEKSAEEWLASLPQNRAMNPDWIPAYRRAFETWKQDRSLDTVVQGTHVKLWPAVNKAQAEVLLAAQCRSVEDLASANEETIARIGIGARELQQRAKAWLETAHDTGRVAEQIVALRTLKEEQAERIKALELQVAALAAGQAPNKTRTITPTDDFS